eukprot:Em0008g600a
MSHEYRSEGHTNSGVKSHEILIQSDSQSNAACDESSSLAEVIRINQVQDKELRALRITVEDQNTKIASLTITVEDINRIAPRTQENDPKGLRQFLRICLEVVLVTMHNVTLPSLLSNQGKVKILADSAREHNRNAMKKELAVQGYTSSIAHRAVRRHFETPKRAHRDSNAEGEELDRLSEPIPPKKKGKKASRSHRHFTRRQAVVRPGEKALWEGLSVYYMTDESDNSDDGINVKHKPPWRPALLDDFMETLDKRCYAVQPVRRAIVLFIVIITGDETF